MKAILQALAAGALLTLLGCPAPKPVCGEFDEELCGDAGALPVDNCNSKTEAVDDPNCVLALGVSKDGFISTLADGGADLDWYSTTLPATVTARSLLHVNAGYAAAQTAVNFSINVLDEAGAASLVTGIDAHGAAAPKPVDLIVPLTPAQAGAKLILLVQDQGSSAQVRVDNRNPYHVLVEVKDNPDTNEPNDATPTPIPLAPSGAVSQGAARGFLATPNDVDKFTFAVAGTARQIIYVHLGTPKALNNPPLPYQLGFTLTDPSGNTIAEEHAANTFVQVDLATAKYTPAPGTYTLVVTGFRPSGSTAAIPGDTRAESEYSVDVRLMPDLDVNEPNDKKTQARPKTISLGGSVSITGRLSAQPDEEWFSFDLPANTQTTVLRYAFRAGTVAGRFPPTSKVPARNIRIVTDVTTGTTPTDKQVQCRTNPAVCPKGYEADVGKQQLVEAICTSADGPMCLWAERLEASQFAQQKNLVGALPVVPHTLTTRYYLMFRDQGVGSSSYSDDMDYTLTVSWESDPADSPSPAALTSTQSEVVGVLPWGHGRIADPLDVNDGVGVRGPDDYDAVQTAIDSYRFTLPAAGDQSWTLQWQIDHPDGGSAPPGDLTLELDYCSGGAGNCTSIRRTLAYTSDMLTPWYLPQSFSNGRTLFSRVTGPNFTTVTALPLGCWCVPAAYASAGYFNVNVGAVNRTSNEPLTYRLRQSVGAYPSTYPGDAGATLTCPSGADGGCRFGL